MEINIIGSIKFDIAFPIKLISINNAGCITPADVIAPVVSIKVIKIGNKLLVNPTKSCIVSFTKEIQFEKLENIIVAININCTKYVICETLLFASESLTEFNILCIIIIISTIPNCTYYTFKLFSKYI